MAAYRPDVRGIRLAPRGEFPGKRNPGVLIVPSQDQPPMLRRDARRGPDPEVRVAGHAAKKKSKARKLIVGDRVGVTIYTPQITQIETEIDTAGKVTLRWVGEVKIAGLTAEEAQAHIKRTYVDQKILQPGVIIDVIAAAQFFYIRGYCTKVGPFPAHMDLTLTRALAMAGGTTEWANKKKIRIHRKASGQEQHNLMRIEANKAKDPFIYPGDIIEVPRKLI